MVGLLTAVTSVSVGEVVSVVDVVVPVETSSEVEVESSHPIESQTKQRSSEEQAAKRNGSRRMIDKTSTGKVCCLTLLIEIKGIRNISTTSALRFSPQVFT